jgi:4-amino-4-deoxy-L-arabinose transferase-like glycosyltransferase
VIAWQLLLGVGTNVLIVLLTARYFSFTAAFCARLPATLYAPFVHYEKLLLRDSTIIFAGLGIVWLTDRAASKPAPTRAALAGLAAGVAFLLKSTFLLLPPLLAIGLMLRAPAGWDDRKH